jgi:hypothetical protein
MPDAPSSTKRSHQRSTTGRRRRLPSGSRRRTTARCSRPRRLSTAIDATSASPANDCSRVIRRFARLCVSVADITRFSSSVPASMARSAPRTFGTSAVKTTPGTRAMPRMTSSASRSAGIAFGDTNAVTSIFARPVRDERVDERDLVGRRHEDRFHLEAVARPDFLHVDAASAAVPDGAHATTPRSRSAATCASVSPIFAEHGVGVVAEVRRGRPDAARRRGQFRHDARHVDVVAVARVLREDHVAGAVVRVLVDVLRGVDLAGRHARRGRVSRGRRRRCATAVHAPIAASISATRATRPALSARSGAMPRSGQPMTSINRLKMLSPLPAIERVAVGAAIRVRRRDAGQRRARGLAHDAERAVLGDRAFHHVEHGLVERDVDHLPRPPWTLRW